MSDTLAIQASAFYRDCSLALMAEANDLRADDHPELADDAAELAGIALVASYQELNPHDAPDVPWCVCAECQKWLFELRWSKQHPGVPRG